MQFTYVQNLFIIRLQFTLDQTILTSLNYCSATPLPSLWKVILRESFVSSDVFLIIFYLEWFLYRALLLVFIVFKNLI